MGGMQRLGELHLRALLHVQLLHQGRLLHCHLHLAHIKPRPSSIVLQSRYTLIHHLTLSSKRTGNVSEFCTLVINDLALY